MKRTCILNLIVWAAFGSSASFAATNETSTPATNSLTLEQLVAEGMEKNPELRFYEAEIRAARAGRRTAGRLANPELSAGVGQKSVSGGGLSGEGVAWSVSVMQPFEWPGRIGLRKAIANRDIELAELGLERFRSALKGRIRTLAYGLLAAQEKATAANEVAARFKELREILVQREPAGLTPLLGTRVIEATELNAQRKATEATLAAKSALLELSQLRGMSPAAQFSVNSTPLVFPPPERLDVLIALAQTNNFDLRLRAVELSQQGFRVALAKNDRYPAVSVGPTVSEERAGDRERVVGIGISLPLPLWNGNRGNIEAAEARQVQAETMLSVAKREVERNVAEASLIYETKLREMGNWRKDSVEQFRAAAELADRHYRLGAVPITTFVELQKQYLEAVEGLLDTRKEALEAAARLELLTGWSIRGLTEATTEEKPR